MDVDGESAALQTMQNMPLPINCRSLGRITVQVSEDRKGIIIEFIPPAYNPDRDPDSILKNGFQDTIYVIPLKSLPLGANLDDTRLAISSHIRNLMTQILMITENEAELPESERTYTPMKVKEEILRYIKSRYPLVENESEP